MDQAATLETAINIVTCILYYSPLTDKIVLSVLLMRV